jgi:glycosyltransferase involved in cell wall biosynthesis
MKISFLVPDVNGPVLGPVTVLARHLEKHFDVEIVGPDLGHGVCAMYRGAYPYRVVTAPKLYRFPEYFRERRRLGESLDGDVIVPVKAVADTIPVALRARRQRGARVVPYLDEWDGAVIRQMPWAQRWRRRLANLHHPLDDAYAPMVERLIPRCDDVISTSTFLQRRFGGHVVPMGVDCGYFAPAPADAVRNLKRELGIEGNRLVVFGGVARPHKGLELIPEAMVTLGDESVRFVIVGPVNEHAKALAEHPAYGRHVVTTGPQPRDRMPLYLSLADLIVLPLQDSLLAQSQVPCKIFEAMAMAKPVIASAVSDMPEILRDAGWVVPPGDVAALAAAMSHVFSHPDEARARGNAARERCRTLYSKEATERLLVKIFRSLRS